MAGQKNLNTLYINSCTTFGSLIFLEVSLLLNEKSKERRILFSISYLLLYEWYLEIFLV
jgi:hypothetical protein